MVRLYELSVKLGMNEFYNTSGITITIPANESYSDEVIEKAKQVKAKHLEEQKKAAEKGVNLKLYSDSWYIEFAKGLKKQYLVGRSKEIFDNSALKCPIKDPQWAGYSYDEIIEMENNGVIIPEEVRQWAHAQQQADITDYIIISEDTTTEDTSASSEESTNNNDLNSLQTKAKQYILKAENAQTETETQYTEHQKKADNAKKIKKEKEDTYKDSMNELVERTKEWKELDQKQKQGERLSFKDRIRYNFLSKMLDTSNGTLLKEVQADQNNLDDFLDSLDAMNLKNDENITLGQETVKAGEDLSQYGKTFNKETHETTGVVNNDMGLTSETLNNIPEDDIAEIAVQTGKDLEAYADTIVTDLNSTESIELNSFAKDYSNLAGQTIEKVEQKDENNEEQDETNENNSEFEGYSVSKVFSWQNSISASETTNRAIRELLGQQIDVSTASQKAQKDLKSTEKDIKNLAKEVEKAARTHETNIEQETSILQELEALETQEQTDKIEQTATPDETDETETNPKDINNAAPKQTAAKTENTTTKAETEAGNSGEAENKIQEIETLNTQNEQSESQVQNIALKNAAANAKYTQTAKLLNTQTNELDKRSINLHKVSTDTVVVGAGTLSKSFITTAFGVNQVTTGSALMSSPFTFSEGVHLTILGAFNILQGTFEAAFGTEAIVNGADGIKTSKEADENVTDASALNKNLNTAIKLSNQAIKETGTDVETQDTEGAQKSETSSGETKTESAESVSDKLPAEELPAETDIANTETTDTLAAQETEPTTETEQTTENPDEITTSEETSPDEETNPANETNNASETDNTDQTGQNTENEENTGETSNNKGGTYSVSLEFTSSNSVAATQTTNQATSDMLLSSRGVSKSTASVAQQTKKSSDLVKNIDKETKKAVNEQENNKEQVQNITTEIASAQAEVQNASSIEEAQNAQDKVETLTTELEETDESAKTTLDKSVVNSVKQLLQFKKDIKDLGSDNTSLNSIISNQLKVSEKTLAVGIGTGAVGVMNTIMGNTQIVEGTALMSSPFTYSAGLQLTITGGIKLVKGLIEISTGTIAAATGTSGIVSNASAKEIAQDAATAKKEAEAKYKDANKEIEDNINLVEENETEDEDNNIPATEEPEIPPQEDEEIDETLLAGSASTNVSLSATGETDDKADKKLTRFNTDSIIESKKKQKKVQAIKASSKG